MGLEEREKKERWKGKEVEREMEVRVSGGQNALAKQTHENMKPTYNI